MHTSDTYKQMIQATARFIRGQVTIGTTTHTDTTTLSALTVDSGAGIGKVIGLAVSAGAEIALTGGATKPNAGETVQITFWADELPDESVPLPPMTVETVEADDDTGETIIIAHDGMRLLEKHTVSEITVDYPTTIGRYAAALAATAGLELTAQDWIGAETILPGPPNFNGTETCRAALAAVAETAFGNAYIGRDGKIVIRSVVISGEGYAIHPDSYFSCEVGSPWGPINTLVLGREPQGDNIYREDGAAVAKHGRIALQISDNPFLDGIRENIIDDMFAHINGTIIQPYELDFRGDPALDPGDVILLTDTNGVQRTAVYGAQTLEFDGGMRVAVGMNAPSNATADYTKAASVKESLRKTLLEVDKVKGEIRSTVKKDDVISSINQSAEAVRIAAQKIEFTGNMILTGKFTTTAEVFFEPGFDELQKVEKFMLGEEIPTEEDLTLYDLYGDGGVGLEDYAAYKAAVYGERSLLDAWVREDYPMKKSIATVTIDISTPQKAFRIQGVNMWGREIDEYWGANSLFSGADAHKNFNEMLRKSDPISNFDCLPNTIILGKHQIYWGQMRVKYAATTASGAIFYGDSTSIENGVFNYCSFTEPPTVHLTLRQGTTSVICLAATEVDTEGIKSIRIHRATSYTDTEGILVDYIAVGEAAQ